MMGTDIKVAVLFYRGSGSSIGAGSDTFAKAKSGAHSGQIQFAFSDDMSFVAIMDVPQSGQDFRNTPQSEHSHSGT
jgi:hypothetical protein